MFSSILVGAMFMACFALCFTLSMAEVAQYISFSTARAYFAGHVSQSAQRDAGLLKYQQLASRQPFRSLFFKPGGFFALPSQPLLGDFNSEYPQPGADSDSYVGARIKFRANILEFRVPIWGSVEAPDGDGFSADVSTYLMREPSSDECMNNWNAADGRFTGMKRLDPAYSTGFRFPEKYYVITDNGC